MSNQSGAEVEATEYLPFGGMRVHTGLTVTDYKFTDQELDTTTNLYNYDARLYDPVIGRFISPDSIVPDYYNPQSLNRYSYTRNNPLKYTDPDGHEPVSLSITAGYASYALGTAIAVGIAHYASPLAADLGRWLGEKLSEIIDNSRNSPTIDPGKQGKHIPGHNNFIPGRSELTHPNPQGLLDDYAGTGKKVGNKEYVDFGQIIGNIVDPQTGEKQETKRGTIHYDEKGKAHIVPAPPEASSENEDKQDNPNNQNVENNSSNGNDDI